MRSLSFIQPVCLVLTGVLLGYLAGKREGCEPNPNPAEDKVTEAADALIAAIDSQKPIFKILVDNTNFLRRNQVSLTEHLNKAQSSTNSNSKRENENIQRSVAQKSCLEPITAPYFCPGKISDNKAWRLKRKKLDYQDRGGWHRGSFKDDSIPLSPTWFCDKVLNTIRPWKAPDKSILTARDIMIGIYTGDNVMFSRTTALRDTWLSHFPHLFFSISDHPNIPVIGLGKKYGLKPLHVKPTDVTGIQVFGLKELYDRQPDKKWYYIVGCDTYVNPDYLLNFLQDYDASEDWYISPGVGPDVLPPEIDTSGFPNWKGGPSRSFVWGSGARGWFLSNSVAKAYAGAVVKFMKGGAPQKYLCLGCPDRITGALLQLLGFDPHVPKGLVDRMQAYAVDRGGRAFDELPDEAEPGDVNDLLLYHYVHPWKMLAIHQRAQHEKLDRLINAGSIASVLEFFRETIDIHFYTLRKRMVEVKHLAKRIPHLRFRSWAIPDVWNPNDEARPAKEAQDDLSDCVIKVAPLHNEDGD